MSFFTICIPVYNGEQFIRDAILSIRNQTCDDWELIIVDNKSTDSTWNILQSLPGDARITVLQNSSNIGMQGNLNQCLTRITGEWALFLPVDDQLAPHALATIKDNLSTRPNVSMWIHGHFVSGEGIPPNACLSTRVVSVINNLELSFRLFLQGNVYGEWCNYAFRASRVKGAGLKFSGPPTKCDLGFWIDFLRSNPSEETLLWPDLLARITQHNRSLSTITTNDHSAYDELFEGVHDTLKHSWPKRLLIRQFGRCIWMYVRFRQYLSSSGHEHVRKSLRSILRQVFLGSKEKREDTSN